MSFCALTKPYLRVLVGALLSINFSFVAAVTTQHSLDLSSYSRSHRSFSAPDWVKVIYRHEYDGESDDLVTAGLGFTQLTHNVQQILSTKPPYSLHTLRQMRLARQINGRNGEGNYFGFRHSELTPLFDGRIAGLEILAQQILANDNNVNMLLQIPIDFETSNPCLVVVPTSGANGLFNAKDVQIRGLWGLRHNCAVIYNDKGLGNTLVNLSQKQALTNDGQISRQLTKPPFAYLLPKDKNFATKYPNRFALSQLHSQRNPEVHAAEYLLRSIQFALYQLNAEFTEDNSKIIFNRENTLVLVYAAEDGAGAALKAAEKDANGLIDGIVAVNPQIQPAPLMPLQLIRPKQQLMLKPKPLIDYATYGNLYIPCAVLAVQKHSKQPIPLANQLFYAKGRCTSLAQKGLLNSKTVSAQAEEALHKLHSYGWPKSADPQLAYLYLHGYNSYAYRYLSALGQYRVDHNLCNYQLASVDQQPSGLGTIKPLYKQQFIQLWASANGSLPIYNTDQQPAIDLVTLNDPRSPRRDLFAKSPSTNRLDYNLDGALCLRQLVTTKLTENMQRNLAHVQSTGRLNRIKTIIVQGRANPLQLPNQGARAYVALNSEMDGEARRISYIEVTNSSYLDGEAPFSNHLIPIDKYGDEAMDWLWQNAKTGKALPPSQVIYTRLPTKAAQTLKSSNMPAILATVPPQQQIQIHNGKIILPD